MQSLSHNFSRIAVHRERGRSKAYIRGSRIPVATIISYLGSGMTVDEILSEWPELEREDVYQALRYSAWEKGQNGPL